MKPASNAQRSSSYKSCFRPEIDAMEGYAPGEQPKSPGLVKLNTNENPYPPAPGVLEFLRSCDPAKLRLYPDPVGSELRRFIGEMHGLDEANVIVGNGSDDILTIVARSFVDASRPLACFDPSYSLYPVLAELQGAPCVKISLDASFDIPEEWAKKAAGANILMIARPNAPTGNSFPLSKIERICDEFKGVVLIDEAYVDFAEDRCEGLLKGRSNVIVSRTFSKSRSLAGARFGYALACPEIIEGMMKVKDSYNVNYLTQQVALAALRDPAYLAGNVAKIKASRSKLAKDLKALGFSLVPSQTNFLFASPPSGDGRRYFDELRKRNIIVRYFSAPRTASFVRITIGTEEEMAKLLEATKAILSDRG